MPDGSNITDERQDAQTTAKHRMFIGRMQYK